MIVVATWPLMLNVQRFFGGRRGLAVAAMSTGLFAVIVAPVALLIVRFPSVICTVTVLSNQCVEALGVPGLFGEVGYGGGAACATVGVRLIARHGAREINAKRSTGAQMTRSPSGAGCAARANIG